MADAVFVAIINCTDPARENQFNDWYTNTHLPDILALPGFQAATRYRLVGQPRPGQGRYLALYEIEADDVAAAVENVGKTAPQRRAAGRMFDGLEAVYVAGYRPITGRMAPSGANPAIAAPGHPRSRGVLVVGSNCADPAQEAEFNDYYTNLVVPDVLSLPGFISGTRYQIIGESQRNEGRYLALYQIEADDIAAAADHLWQAIAEWRVRGHGAEGRHFQGLELVYTAVYEAMSDRITA